ncbi:MAG: glycosyltransferase family 39 protein [Nanoarchaeota archaeon]|nr:glycosyltransferase family 39 protein [Nanoarchaeota archaeon]
MDKKKGFAVWGVISLVFLLVKIAALRFKFSDGYTYMYMGKLILEGLVPYKDFFFASPPLQAYIMALGLLVVGSKVILLKFIPILFTLGSGFFVYDFVRRKFGVAQGLVSSILYLFSFLVLLTTDYSTGVHISAFFVLGMVYFIELGKPVVSGIFGSLAMLTRLYSPFAIAGVGLYVLIWKRKWFWKFILSCGGLFLIVSLFFEIISGNYVLNVFLFRMGLVKGIGLNKWNVFKFFFKGDFVLVLGSIGWLLFGKGKRKLLVPGLVSLFLIMFYAVYSDVYYLYFGLIVGCLAMFATRFIFLFRKLRCFKWGVVVFLILLTCWNVGFYFKNHVSSANIDFIDELVELVEENSLESDTIYGSFDIVPLVGLLSGRRLAGNIADTNPKNLMTGMVEVEDIVEKIRGVKFIITKISLDSRGNTLGFGLSIPADFLKKECEVVKVYLVKKDYSDNAVVLWDCDN